MAAQIQSSQQQRPDFADGGDHRRIECDVVALLLKAEANAQGNRKGRSHRDEDCPGRSAAVGHLTGAHGGPGSNHRNAAQSRRMIGLHFISLPYNNGKSTGRSRRSDPRRYCRPPQTPPSHIVGRSTLHAIPPTPRSRYSPPTIRQWSNLQAPLTSNQEKCYPPAMDPRFTPDTE